MCSLWRMPRRRSPPPSPTDGTHAARQTQVEPARSEPRMPHERDESADSQHDASTPDAAAEQGARDAQRGMPDTDRGPVVDRLYNDRVRQPKSS